MHKEVVYDVIFSVHRMADCRLNILPVELLHGVFEYFWAHEILQSFSNVSEHVNAVPLNYPTYQINFQDNQRKKQFDLGCDRIRPDQILSLRTSDEKYIGQSELFFSRFQLEQFPQLHSLTFVEIEDNSLSIIFHRLANLPQLRSLTLNRQEFIHQLEYSFELLSKLNRLISNDHINFDNKSFANLTCLHLSSEYSLDDI